MIPSFQFFRPLVIWAIIVPLTAAIIPGTGPVAAQEPDERPKRPVPTPSDWVQQKIDETTATIRFPAEPGGFETKLPLPAEDRTILIRGYRLVLDDGDRLLSVKYYPVTVPGAVGNDAVRKKVLEKAERNTLAMVLAGFPLPGSVIEDGENARYREFQYQFRHRRTPEAEPTAWMAVTRYHIVKSTMVEMTVIQKLDRFDRELANQFIDSFRAEPDPK